MLSCFVYIHLSKLHSEVKGSLQACCDLQASSCISTPVGWSLLEFAGVWSLAASCLWGDKIVKHNSPVWRKEGGCCHVLNPKATPSWVFITCGNPGYWVTVEWMPRGCCYVKCLLISEAFRLGWQWHSVFSQGSGSFVTHGFGCTWT